MVVPSRGCKKKLTKHHNRLNPQPPKKKAIRVCATAVPHADTATTMATMCSSGTVAVPTALSSASSSVSERTLPHLRSHPHSYSHLIKQPSRPSTNLTTVTTTIRTNQQRAPDKKASQSQSQTTITNGKSSTSSVDDKTLFEIDRSVQSLYKVNDRLGKGAYGVVWKAEEKKTGRNIALKKIFDAFRNSTDAQRTYREIIFLQEFGCHPNIIRLLNVHRASNNLDIYLTFPLLDSDLHKVIKQGTNLKDNAIRFIFYQILKAVKYLHSAEVIHRDLKPANILLDKHYNVKVADFGLARSVKGLTNENNFDASECETLMTEYVATRWYRPPEILLANRSYSKGVDMWGLGCILGEMLLRKAVFAGASTVEQIQIIVSTIPRPRPEEIQDLCSTSGNSSVVESAASKRGISLYELFEKNFCNPDAVDLAEKLLVFHPSLRISVEEALSHIFLAKYRDEAEEVAMPYVVSPPLDDNVQLHMSEYQSAIYDMLSSQRPKPRPKTTGAGVSARSVMTTRARDTVSREKKLELPKVRPGVGRKVANLPNSPYLAAQTCGDQSKALSNVNNRLKAIKSSIAWVLNKNGCSEDLHEATADHHHQFGADRGGSGDQSQSEYFPQIQARNPTPYNNSRSDVEMQYGYSRPPTRAMEPIAEVDMDVSDSDYEEQLAKVCDRSVQIILNRCDAPSQPQPQSHPLLHATQSEGDLNRDCDPFGPFGCTGAGTAVKRIDDPSPFYVDEVRLVPAARVETGRFRRANGNSNGKGPHEVRHPIAAAANNVRRLTIPLTRLPVSKGSLDASSSHKDLGLAQNLREVTADWHYQGIQGGRQMNVNKKTQPQPQQKHFPQSKARLPPKLSAPSRSTTNFNFHVTTTTPDENRPRIQHHQHQHSSYFPDKYNTKRNCFDVSSPPKQQPVSEMKHRRVFDSYTQTHGTISASELCELKNFSLNGKK